jgi:type I restriction enzyme, S subunit
VSDALPQGWTSATIRKHFRVWGGMTPSTSNRSYWNGSIPWISSKDIKGDRIAEGTEFITEAALRETRLRVCRPGSVLLVVRSGVLAHTLPLAITEAPVVINQDLKALDSGDNYLNEWLVLSLRSQTRRILEANRKEGTTVQSVRIEELLDLEIPVPPAAEQRRIVAKAEELLAQVGATATRLTRVRDVLRRFDRSVLASACSGKLTADTAFQPTESPKGLDPADRASTADLFGLYPELAEVSDRWQWTTFRNLVESSFYGPRFPASDYSAESKEGIPTIRTSDIGFDGRIHFANPPRLRLTPEQLGKFGLRDGDFLVTRTGATIGKCAVYSADVGSAIPSAYLIRFRLRKEYVDPDFVALFFRSVYGQYLLGVSQTAVAQPNVNARTIGDFPFPVPTIGEQRDVVNRVRDLTSFAGAVQRHAVGAQARLRTLPQAILLKAFSGELVPNEAELARTEGRDYESGSKLLERTLVEKSRRNDGNHRFVAHQSKARGVRKKK